MVSEINIFKKKIRRDTVRIAYVYPNTYEAHLSSLAVHMIYYMVNIYPEVYMERFIYSEGEPRSIETGSPLRDFKFIIASIHYELDYPRLIEILERGGVEPNRLKRNMKHIVMVGGPAPISNPEPLHDIADIVLIGEAEPLIPHLVETIIEYSDRPNALLEALGSKGIYVFDRTDIVERVWFKDIDSRVYPVKQIQSLDREPIYGRGFLLESSRGCPFWCRFCLESRIFKPYRPRSYSVLRELVDRGLSVNSVRRVILYSLYFLGSPSERRLLEYLVESKVSVSIPSLRLDVLGDDVLELIRLSRQKMLTVAAENISSFGKKVLCKCFRVGDELSVLYRVLSKGFDLKLYFILGIKGEPLESIKENIEFIRRVASYARRLGRRVAITVNPLIPKPKTPFQWIGMLELDRARNIIKLVRSELGGIVDTRPLHVNWGWVQASIALARRDISRLILEWGLRGGGLGAWRSILKNHGYSTRYVFEGHRYGEYLPWDRVRIGCFVEEVCEKEYIALSRLISSS